MTGRPCTTGAAEKAATVVLEMVRLVNSGTTPYERHSPHPWQEPWARRVLWYSLVPERTARAGTHGDNRAAAVMGPRVAAKVAVIEPTMQTCLGRCGVDPFTETYDMT